GRVAPRDQRLELLFRKIANLGVAGSGELFGLGQVADDGFVLAKPLDERLHFGQRLRLLSILGRIALHLHRAEPAHQILVSLFFRRKLVKHPELLNECQIPNPELFERIPNSKFPIPNSYPPDTGGRNATSSPSPRTRSMRA